MGRIFMRNSMHRRTFFSLSLGATAALLSRSESATANRRNEIYDLVIYGGSSAGVIAAVQAARLGKTAVIVNPYSFLGGMTASGLNAADIDNPAVVSGITREFFAEMGRAYGEG